MTRNQILSSMTIDNCIGDGSTCRTQFNSSVFWLTVTQTRMKFSLHYLCVCHCPVFFYNLTRKVVHSPRYKPVMFQNQISKLRWQSLLRWAEHNIDWSLQPRHETQIILSVDVGVGPCLAIPQIFSLTNPWPDLNQPIRSMNWINNTHCNSNRLPTAVSEGSKNWE